MTLNKNVLKFCLRKLSTVFGTLANGAERLLAALTQCVNLEHCVDLVVV